MFREDLVEQRAGPPLAQAGHDLVPSHAEAMEDPAGDESRAVVAHAAMRENAMAVAHEMRTQGGDPLELVKIGQVLVEDRKVDVETAVGQRRNAVVEPA